MSFSTDFATEFSSFRRDLEPDKYSSTASDPILPARLDEVPGPEVENEDEEDIENPGPCSPLSERGLQYLLSIFDRHNSRLWDYVIDVQDSCHSTPANYKTVCQAIQEKFGYKSKPWQAIVIMDIVYGKKRYYGQYKNGERQKFDILSGAFDESRGYSFDNYTYYCAYGRSGKRTQTKRCQCFSTYRCRS